MRRFMNFVAGAICGAAIGAAVGLLLAPAAGEEIRSTATERIIAFRDEIQKAYETRKAQLEAELESLRS
jgi:gas vesicle protein